MCLIQLVTKDIVASIWVKGSDDLEVTEVSGPKLFLQEVCRSMFRAIFNVVLYIFFYLPGHLKFDNTVKEIEVSHEAWVTEAFLVPSLLGGVSFITFTRIKRDTWTQKCV